MALSGTASHWQRHPTRDSKRINESDYPLPDFGVEIRIEAFVDQRRIAITNLQFQMPRAVTGVNNGKAFWNQANCMSSNGNAGGAMAIYAARAGLECVVFMPEDSMPVNLNECHYCGAKLFVTNGLIDQNGKLIREGHNAGLWFDISTMKEPYRLEGKKTMGLELAEQFNWQLPDVILYPTGGGTALIAMWKAFKELREMGYLNSETMPADDRLSIDRVHAALHGVQKQ